ncbi:MAG: transcription antitermination factor NusB [Thermodesulfovibrionales bacterium]|nr:transcription antitermination factor NusB [Thermodesulfovibrionales bacterium]
MKRRRAREYALQALFRMEFTGEHLGKEALKLLCEDDDEAALEFFADIVIGTRKNLNEIDAAIKGAAEHWVLERMAIVDRNILRAAAYELLFRKDIPQAVVINEAIEIAKKYSSSESASFINGILDKIAKESAAPGQNTVAPARKKGSIA